MKSTLKGQNLLPEELISLKEYPFILKLLTCIRVIVAVAVLLQFMLWLTLKGRFLLFQVYHNFANLFSKLSVSTLYKVISKFQQKVQS